MKTYKNLKIFVYTNINNYMGQKNSSHDTYHFDYNERKNVYGKTLKKCQNNVIDNDGSWDINGKCTELNNGVHQICISNMKYDFSKKTSQSNWSTDRIKKPHCVCLGAYALYTSKDNNININCNATPETIFNPAYISKWNHWNGNEQEQQGLHAINHIYKYCKNQTSDNLEKKHIKKLYKHIIKKI